MFEKHVKQTIQSDELDYVSDSKQSLLRDSPKFAKYTLYLLTALVLTTLFWAYYGIIDVTTQASGKVVSASNLQVIENLEGGILETIEVKEGSQVKQGDILLRLDDTQFAAVYNKELARKITLEVEKSRLGSEIAGLDEMQVPDDLRKNYPNIVGPAETLFQKNRDALKDSLKILQDSLALVKRELSIIRPLAAKGAVSEIEKIRLEREANNIKVRINEKLGEYRTNARRELNKVQAELSLINEQITASEDKARRTVIRAPVDGIVNKIYISTIGEVINPGVRIMDIVPINSQLSFEVKVSPADIGFINIGQEASVKITAYDYALYGDLKAKVAHISPDALTDRDGNNFYEVKLVADRNFLGDANRPLKILPGMEVSVNILTDKRSIISYLLQPFIALDRISLGSDE